MKKVGSLFLSFVFVFSMLVGINSNVLGTTKVHAASGWSIKVQGASKKVIKITSADVKKAGIISIKATLKKQEGGKPEINKYKGARLSKVLQVKGIKAYKAIKVVASDGYKRQYTKAQVNASGTILATQKNGETLSKPQTVLTKEKGYMWVKDIVTIIVIK